MKILHDQICRYALGCLNTEGSEEGFIFHRMNGPMQEICINNGPGAVLRMNCSSGVRLRFRTDSKTLRIRLFFGDVPWPKNRVYRIELMIDDKSVGAFGPEQPQDAMTWEETLFQGKSTKTRTFDVWFPHTACVRLLDLAIDDSAQFMEAPALPLRYMAYGDSITQGMQATLPTRIYPARIAQELDAELLNLGVGGAKLQMELANSVPDWSYDFASIAYGTNDANQGISPEIYATNARRLFAAMTANNPGKPIFAITVIPWIPTEKRKEIDLDLYRKALAEAANGIPEVVLVDGPSLIPADPALFIDGVHPNDQGFAIYAQNLLAAMRPHLPSSDSGKKPAQTKSATGKNPDR